MSIEQEDPFIEEVPEVLAGIDAVANMITTAERYDLLFEVVTSFGNHRAEGVSVEEATAAALYDWDI